RKWIGLDRRIIVGKSPVEIVRFLEDISTQFKEHVVAWLGFDCPIEIRDGLFTAAFERIKFAARFIEDRRRGSTFLLDRRLNLFRHIGNGVVVVSLSENRIGRNDALRDKD